MLEFIGTAAVCVVVIWLVRYFWNFRTYRKSIDAVELLASAVKRKADLVAINVGPDAAEKTYFIAVCLKGVADSLSYGKLSNSFAVEAQLQMLSAMIESPDDIAFYLERPVGSVGQFSDSLIKARESFLLLCSAMRVR